MRTQFSLALLACILLPVACGTSFEGPTLTASQVSVPTEHFEATYQREEALGETFMLFGGLSTNRNDMISKITLVGLSMEQARPIHTRFPDFYACKSGGAAMAQQATQQMNMVPADETVLESLEQALTEHASQLQAGGDRVCVKLTGQRLSFASASMDGEDITSQLPQQIKTDCYLIQSAELVDARIALGAN